MGFARVITDYATFAYLADVFVLDGDKQGKDERQRYISEFGLNETNIVTLDEMVHSIKEIEDLLDDEAREIVASRLGISTRITKKHICRYFQENLAQDDVIELGASFRERARVLLEALRNRIEGDES